MKKKYHHKPFWWIRRAWNYGLRYWFDRDFRIEVERKIRNKLSTKRRLRKYGANWNKKKQNYVRILAKQRGAVCEWCWQPLHIQNKKGVSIDHKTPLSEGGKLHDLDNMRLMHVSCHNFMNKLAKTPLSTSGASTVEIFDPK